MKNRTPFFCLQSFCRSVVIALLLLAPMAGVHADASLKKPNVLFIAIDDLKPLLGC